MIRSNQKTQRWDVTCDFCDRSELEVSAATYEAAVRHLRKLDWLITKVYWPGRPWKHICPKCKDDGVGPFTSAVDWIKEKVA